MITIANVIAYHEVVDAVLKGRKVRMLRSDGTLVEGTLRHFSPNDGSAAHYITNGDLERAWIRITTVSGQEVWVRVPELVQARRDSAAGWDL
jgi:hypothetical protein